MLFLLLPAVAHADEAATTTCEVSSWAGPADGDVDVPIDARLLVWSGFHCYPYPVELRDADGETVGVAFEGLGEDLYGVRPAEVLAADADYVAQIVDDWSGEPIEAVAFHTGLTTAAPLSGPPVPTVVSLEVVHQGLWGASSGDMDSSWRLDVAVDASAPLSVLRVLAEDGTPLRAIPGPFSEVETVHVATTGPSQPQGTEQCLTIVQENAAGEALNAGETCAVPTAESWRPKPTSGCNVAPGGVSGLAAIGLLALVRRRRDGAC
ncbi:MAG: hypothetical protein R3F59_28745 [Myxococcota bacterium]